VFSIKESVDREVRRGKAANSPTPARNKCVLDDVIGIAGVVHRQTRTPLGIAHHCCPELRISRQAGVIRRTRKQCDESQALLAGYVLAAGGESRSCAV
jgi:hypothetical protein